MDSRLLRKASKEEILSYKRAFDFLKEILETDIKKKDAVREYAPGWEYKQIAVNEWNAALSDLIKILTIEKD